VATDVIEADSQAALKTITVQDFHDAFKKNGRRAGNGAYSRKETSSSVIVVSRLKVD
jgi:hypothetical protein